MKREYLDRPGPGWFVLDVMRATAKKWDWVALMIDVHPDELQRCQGNIARLYADSGEYRPDENRTVHESWLRIPGKHRDEAAARAVLHEMIVTRH